MATEKELKLALGEPRNNPSGLPSTTADVATQVASITRFFATHSAQPGKTFLLGNVYFDTPDLDLARDKVALRLRRTPTGWLQTLKTAGHVKDGLHARGEWELPVNDDALDLPALLAICDDADAVRSLVQHAPRLASVFRTDFERTTWDLTINGSDIEAALDLGKVHLGDSIAGLAPSPADIAANSVEVPIREIELELKAGDESALWQLARTLQDAIPGLKPDDVSKAARGYRLAREAAAENANRALDNNTNRGGHIANTQDTDSPSIGITAANVNDADKESAV
jgi:inorganic triphosphatase YgiF